MSDDEKKDPPAVGEDLNKMINEIEDVRTRRALIDLIRTLLKLPPRPARRDDDGDGGGEGGVH